MSVHGAPNGGWLVRWREGDGGRRSRQRTRKFDRKGDAVAFDAEVRRRRQVGGVVSIDLGREPLDQYVTGVWARSNTAHLAPKTLGHYVWLYDIHVSPHLGDTRLCDLTPEVIGRWYTNRLAAGSGRTAVRQALELLGSILQRAVESRRLQSNPARLVRKQKRIRKEVRPLAPASVEAMRAAVGPRDATLFSVLAYAGLRPGEAIALTWHDVRERTLLVERAASLGEAADTKTRAHRSVRLLAPLGADLREWRLASGRPAATELLFPRADGDLWTKVDWDNWRRRVFQVAAAVAGVGSLESRVVRVDDKRRRRERTRYVGPRPYDLRHSFASLLLHEGRSVIYVARQMGHNATLTLGTYGHVIEELEDQSQVSAELVIAEARRALRDAA